MSAKANWLLFFQILAVGVISISIIFSINRDLAANQFLFWVVGLTILFAVSHIDFRFIEEISIQFYVLSVIALIALLIIGDPIKGSVRWVELGIFRIQPSEVAKAASIFLMATFYKSRSAASFKNFIF